MVQVYQRMDVMSVPAARAIQTVSKIVPLIWRYRTVLAAANRFLRTQTCTGPSFRVDKVVSRRSRWLGSRLFSRSFGTGLFSVIALSNRICARFQSSANWLCFFNCLCFAFRYSCFEFPGEPRRLALFFQIGLTVTKPRHL